MTIFHYALTSSEQTRRTLWQILTGHRAVFAYLVILLAALIALMLIMILKYARDMKAREAERKKLKEKRRFSRLCALDEQRKKAGRPHFDDNVSLAGLCEKFRDFAASEMGLYYEESVIRAFVSSLAVSRLVIMQGISGTGKTSLSYAFGKFLRHEASIVPVQPSWKDKTDMLGYYNEFTGNFTETELLCRLYEANDSDAVFITVLDEMNIARVEYYFAEFLSVLELPELESRKIEVISDTADNDPELFDNGRLTVPDNVWFVGTANNDDSTLSISDKVYDRAMVIELQSRAKPFSAPHTEPVSISASYLSGLFTKAEDEFPMSEEMKTKIERIDAYLTSRLQITFGNRIMTQTMKFVPVFRACGGTEEQAVDLILSKKVLRKLEAQNPVYVSAQAEGLLSELDRVFGEGVMTQCLSYVRRYVKL
ncbi:MAG: hypothetical protein J6330_05480 [Clostridia bacterium]|nr:hypothetical protein [Clostridia bacterium]